MPSQTNAATSARSGRPALVLAVLAIVLVAGGLLWGYRYQAALTQEITALNARVGNALEQQQRLQQALQEATDTLRIQASAAGEQGDLLKEQRRAVNEARSTFAQQKQRMADDQRRLQEREAELSAALADVVSRVGRSSNRWMLAEAEHLLRIASQQMDLAGDADAARAALELADERLRDTKEPRWAGVREQIARDIDKLRAFQAPDQAALSAQLDGLIGQITQLPLAPDTIGPERTLPVAEGAMSGERGWQTLFTDIWAALRDSVRIRDRGQPVPTMLAPKQEFFLYENLKLQLEAARLALARSDQALFRNRLRSTAEWLAEHFDATASTTASFSESIDDLLKVEIQPRRPDISLSLAQLRARLEQTDESPGLGVLAQ